MHKHLVPLIALLLVAELTVAQSIAQPEPEANPLTYLDKYCDAYYPHTEFAKLTTPQ